MLKGGPSVECETFYLNIGWTLMLSSKVCRICKRNNEGPVIHAAKLYILYGSIKAVVEFHSV